MDNLLAPLRDAFEGQIDFQGQRLTELLSTVLLALSGVIAFVVGFIYQEIYFTLWILLAGVVLTALVIIPPWPVYNKHPEKWLVPAGGIAGAVGIVVDGAKVG
jgi:signal peptidase complex subunit 1